MITTAWKCDFHGVVIMLPSSGNFGGRQARDVESRLSIATLPSQNEQKMTGNVEEKTREVWRFANLFLPLHPKNTVLAFQNLSIQAIGLLGSIWLEAKQKIWKL